jgi:hypothetical protein
VLDTITEDMLAEEIPAVHELSTNAKDGDMCLYAPQNTITLADSGKRIYFDWKKFKEPLGEDEYATISLRCSAIVDDVEYLVLELHVQRYEYDDHY